MNNIPIISTKLKQMFVISTVFTLGWMVIMSLVIKPLNSKDIVSFELARTPEVATKIMLEWEEKDLVNNARKSIYLDFVFLVLYSLSITLGCLVLSAFTGNHFLIRTGQALSKIVPFAGLFDGIENLAMLKTFTGEITMQWTAIAYWFASIKFLIVLCTLLFLFGCLIFGGLRRTLNRQ
ncbi:MAG: hypothetical protein AABY93_12285 [Bacteroidota bacterium]